MHEIKTVMVPGTGADHASLIPRDLIGEGRFRLKNGTDFHDHEKEAAEELKRKRNRGDYARLDIFRKENQEDA